MSGTSKLKSTTAAKPTASTTAAKKPVVASRTKASNIVNSAAKSKAAPAAKRKASIKATKPVAKGKAGKSAEGLTGKKEKTVRDSFNMPAADYALIGQMKARALAGSREVKKSELLRAGLRLLAGMTDAALLAALSAVPSIKTGRPGKKHKG
jgi:hypothetical protein